MTNTPDNTKTLETDLIEQVGAMEVMALNPDSEAGWIDVIHKMDDVYADLVRYQVELEEKNAALEVAQQFISSVLASITDVLIVCDTHYLMTEFSTMTLAYCCCLPAYCCCYYYSF